MTEKPMNARNVRANTLIRKSKLQQPSATSQRSCWWKVKKANKFKGNFIGVVAAATAATAAAVTLVTVAIWVCVLINSVKWSLF